ncbi:MAG: CvpA family protein [Clostridia bacterium]|nr:CvpA family protein [Clostridia bacterium]
MNIIDIIILAVLGVSVVFGLYRGFISGVLSVAALIGSAALAFAMSGDMAAWLQGNQTLIDTLMYYTDAGSRITNLDLSLLSVAQVTENALVQILDSARLPAAFEAAFVENIGLSEGAATISSVLSKTIVNVSISILSFLICFLIAYVVLTFVIHLLNYVFELPVLRHLDSLIGGVFGLARGVLLLFIFFSVVPIVMAVVPIEPLEAMIEASQLAPIFDSRMIMAILNGGI